MLRRLVAHTACAALICATSTICARAYAETPQTAAPERAADDVPRPLTLDAAIRIAVRRSDAIDATRQAAQATREAGEARGALPAPELIGSALRVPLARPWALGDAMMVSVSVRQSFPANGALGARQRADEIRATALEQSASDRERHVARDVAHAFVEVQAASLRHDAHLAHARALTQIVEVTRARLDAGGARAVDVARAEAQRAMVDADLATETAAIARAKAQLNALLRRDPYAALEVVPLGDAKSSVIDARTALRMAREGRADVRAVDANARALDEEAAALRQEARWPKWSVTAGWTAPTGAIPGHGYALTLTTTLPWLWGPEKDLARAGASRAIAAHSEAREARARVVTEVASANADAVAYAEKLDALVSRALPASQSAYAIALSSYAHGDGDAVSLLGAQRAVVEAEVAVIDTRVRLAHAVTELEWTVGARSTSAGGRRADGGSR